MRTLLASLAIAITIAASQAVTAGPLEDGKAAYDRKDFAKALQLWRPLAEQGNAWAQANLGSMYGLGNGVTRDYKEAVRWYRLAAAQGNELGQLNLGASYFTGRGVSQDYVRAYMWWSLSATAVGYSVAAENRNTVTAKMTPAQIAQAQEMSRKCQASNYKNCD